MTLIGYIAFLDPPRESAAPALQALASHGIQVKVLTGDNELVLLSVCRHVGLPAGQLLLGAQIEPMGEKALALAVEQHQLFAKLTPMHKERIVHALRSNGHVVGSWATASTTHRRCAQPTSASRSIRRSTLPRRRPTSFCSKKA